MSDDLVSVEMSHPMCIMRTKDIKHLYDRIEELKAKGLANRVAIMRLEAELANALEALGKAIYLLNPDEEDIAKGSGLYRIVTTHKELTGDKDVG